MKWHEIVGKHTQMQEKLNSPHQKGWDTALSEIVTFSLLILACVTVGVGPDLSL